MSYFAYMICETCKEMIFVGKLRHDAECSRAWLSHPDLPQDALSQKLQSFAAQHLIHGVRILTDDALFSNSEVLEYSATDDRYGDMSRTEINECLERRMKMIRESQAAEPDLNEPH